MGNFKVGDVVVCVDDRGQEEHLRKGQEYVITYVYDNTYVAVNHVRNNYGWYASRFELKQQPAEQPVQIPVQQKTKTIRPSCVEDWHKAVGMYFGGVKVKEFKYVATEYEVAVCFISDFNGAFFKGGFDSEIKLEIPVTTKRIPFDPERKGAKVFYGEQELLEWVQMKSGVVCGTIKLDNFNDEHTSLYHPNDLKMEIEE